MLVDPERKAYKALSFHRSVWGSIGFRAIKNLWRAYRGGHHTGRLQGDPWQMGGTIVLVPPGEVLYLHKSRYSGDHADVEKISKVLKEYAESMTPKLIPENN